MTRPIPPLAAAAAALALAGALPAQPARADTVAARCEVAPALQAQPRVAMGCTFSQRQGHIGIELADGRRIDYEPAGGRRLRDGQGRTVRQSVSPRGQVLRSALETVRVDWDIGDLPAWVPGRPPDEAPFDRTLSRGRLALRVTSPNSGPMNRVAITPAGLRADNTPWVRELRGRVIDTTWADLDTDGWPELYVVLRGAGPREAGALLAVAVNRGRSISEIALPELTPAQAAGHRGGDEFAVVENRLVRRWRVYRDDDADTRPTGGWRQLQYRLERGEAMWQLKVDRVVDF